MIYRNLKTPLYSLKTKVYDRILNKRNKAIQIILFHLFSMYVTRVPYPCVLARISGITPAFLFFTHISALRKMYTVLYDVK